MSDTFETILTLIVAFLVFVLVLALRFFVTAGLVWVIIWGLNAIGITEVFGWTISFSWYLVAVVTALSYIFRKKVIVQKQQ